MSALRFLFNSDDELACWLRIGIVSVAVIALLTSYMNSPPGVSTEKRHYTEEEKQHEIVKETESGLAMDGPEKHKQPQASKSEPEKKFIKDKRDLNAQEGVWRATNLVAFLTILATSLAALGVYFLRQTMIATGETLRHAEETSKAAFESLNVTRNSSKGVVLAVEVKHHQQRTIGRIDHTLMFDIANIGNGIAICKSATVGGKDTTGESEFAIDLDISDVITMIETFSSAAAKEKVVYEDFELQRAPISHAENRFFAWCIIDYIDGFGYEWRSTCTFRSSGNNDMSGGIAFMKHGFVDAEINRERTSGEEENKKI